MKTQIISKIDPFKYYQKHIPSLEKISDESAEGICPFCQDPKKTFEAVLSNKNFFCYSCNIGGDPIKFFSLKEKKTEPAALRALAEEMGIEYSEDDPELVEKVEKVEKIGDINKDLIPICPFPLEALPTGFRNTVEKVASFFDVENGFVAGTMLAIVSGAIGNSVLISAKSDYEAPIFIWFIVIAESGFGKSPVMNYLMNPVRQFKKNSQVGALSSFRLNLRHFIVSDTTVEALALVFIADPRGVILHKDELSGLILGMNQYRGNKGSDRQQYLQLFDCQSWSINRVLRGDLFAPKTGAAIIGGIQTGVMTKVFNAESFEDGLIYRFILDCPEVKPRIFNRETLSSEIKEHWSSLLRQCYTIPFCKIPDTCSFENTNLFLGEDALTCFESFYNDYNSFVPHLSNMAKGFIPKLITYSLKFAGLIHVIQQIENKEDIGSTISADTMGKAITLTRYYAGQAMKLVKIYTEDMDSQAKRILTILNDLRGEVHNGRLPMKKIQEAYNHGLPEQFQIKSNKMLGTKLREYGLKTKSGTGGLTDLLWDEEKIRGILS